MFAITFENELYKQWCCEYIFETFDDTKEYLLNKGFIEKNRVFIRENYNWSKYMKAYVSPMKLYSK